MKNKSLKKFFAVFLSTAMSLSLYVTPVFAETTEESVTENVQAEMEAQENAEDENLVVDTETELPEAEENVSDVALPVEGDSGACHWKIDTNGTLTISGNGDYVLDYNYIDSYAATIPLPTWCQYASQIKKAVVAATDLTSTAYMFYGCSALTSVDLNNFNTGKVTNMESMFYKCSGLKSLDLSNFDTSNVTYMNYMFVDCSGLTSLDLSNFNTGNVTYMHGMFAGCSSLKKLNISNFDTKNVTTMTAIFSGCNNLQSLDVSEFNTENVINMGYMFQDCNSLTSLDVSKFNTGKVTKMASMFNGCSNLTRLDVGNFDTKNVIRMDGMFARCSKLVNLDLSNFSTEKAYMDGVFGNCTNLTSIKMPANVKCDANLPCDETGKIYGTWKDEHGNVCTQVTKNLPNPMTYKKETASVNSTPTSVNPAQPQGTKVASYQGNNFYQDGNGKMRCYDANGNMIKNDFKCDGIYTYYFQNDGTDMTDRLTYHPDGEHVIYFDENGHEVFNNFTHVKKSITGDSVDDLCFFDVYGHMYVDFITYDQAGVNLYYANPYGVMEHNGWFQFSDGNIGYANADGTLMTNQFSYDQFGRKVYFQGDGKLAKGLISDGTTYYQMDENDGHCTGEFPVQ